MTKEEKTKQSIEDLIFDISSYFAHTTTLEDVEQVRTCLKEFAEKIRTIDKENTDCEELYVWDGINNQLEDVKDMEDAESYIKECYMEQNSIHPDIESVFVVKKIASVTVHESGEYMDLNGEEVAVCQVMLGDSIIN